MILIMFGRYVTGVSYLLLMFCTPRPMLETSSVPSLRRPLAWVAAVPVPDDDAWCSEATDGTEPSATVAPARAAFVRKSRRPTALACASRDSLFELFIPILFNVSRFKPAIGLVLHQRSDIFSTAAGSRCHCIRFFEIGA